MKLGTPLSALAAVATAVGPLSAEDVTKKPVTLDDCVRMALEKNIDIRIARIVPRVAALELNASFYDYYDPNFQFSATQSENNSPGQGFVNTFQTPPNQTWNERFGTGFSGYLPSGLNYTLQSGISRNSGSSFDPTTLLPTYSPSQYLPSVSVSIDQPLLKNFWIDQSRYQIQINKRTLKANEQDLRNQAITVVTAISDAYFDLLAAREKVLVQQKALELSQQQLTENKKRVEVGAMAPLDEKQAESQVASSRAALLSAESTYGTAEIRLKQLLTDDFASVVSTDFDPQGNMEAIPIVFDRQDSWHKGLTMRPDVISSKLNLEKQNITVRLKKNQVYPQLDLQGSYGITARRFNLSDSLNDVGNRTYPNFSIGVVFSMPLDGKAPRNRLKEAKLQLEQSLLQYQKLEQTVMGDIANAIGVARSAYQRVEATKAARDYALLAFEAEKKKLENGKSTSFVVLQLQSNYTTAASDAIQAVTDYNKSLDALFQSEGSILEHRGVKFVTH
jgi:outer membrane protein